MAQTSIESTRAAFPHRARARPIVRWAGGKTALVPLIATTAYNYLQGSRGTYIEPFLGGGAVALNLGLPNMVLADTCAPLLATYRSVAANVDGVWRAHQRLQQRGWDEATYYAIRDVSPEVEPSPALAAARFLYLNATCFNGIHRENAAGKFNVPYGMKGRKNPPKFRTLDELQQFARAVAASDLHCMDFERTFKLAGPGDFVFADPPYCKTFSHYNAGGFGLGEHQRLADVARAAHDAGVFVCVTNSDTPEVREMYAWADITLTQERRSVSARGDRRGAASCLLITSDASNLATEAERRPIAGAIDS